jgi:hypothetical protein
MSSPRKTKFTSFDKDSVALNPSGISLSPYDVNSNYAGLHFMGKNLYGVFAKVGVSPIDVEPNDAKRIDYEVETLFYDAMNKIVEPVKEWAEDNQGNRFGVAISKGIAFEGASPSSANTYV